jgi:hypothetical protein
VQEDLESTVSFCYNEVFVVARSLKAFVSLLEGCFMGKDVAQGLRTLP